MLFSSNRCKECKKIIAHRFCLRKDKRICWHCCNEMRADFKCPPECEYYLKEKENLTKKLFINAKVDSKSELDELSLLIADYWMNHQEKELNDQIPILMVNNETSKAELFNYLEACHFNYEIQKYLYQRLGFTVPKNDEEEILHFEKVALLYLEHIIKGDLPSALKMYLPAIKHSSDEYRNLLLQHFKSHHSLRKLKQYDLLSSGMSPQTQEAFVSFELNSNQEFTLIMEKVEDQWLVKYQAFGAINLIRTETEALKFIASALVEQNFEKAYRYLSNYKQIYFYSADIYYYEGLYYSLKGENKFAKSAYETAICLDSELIESYYNLAFIEQAENHLDKAKQLYTQILNIKADYLNALNNLGTIYLYEKDYVKAEELFRRCLMYDPSFDYAAKNLEKLESITQKVTE